MLFLLNATVIQVPAVLHLPAGLERLKSATAAGVVDAGRELYTKYPGLERDRPDIAQWYCSLLLAKARPATAALFQQASSRGPITCHLADVSLRTLAQIWALQQAGVSTSAAVSEVWTKALMGQA